MKQLWAVAIAVLAGLWMAAMGGPAAAQDFPAQFEVRDVASDDTLNIRAEPSASSPILGEYGPYALNIEVLGLSADGRWGRVGLPEGNGWASMRYLARQEVPSSEVPRPLRCFGTEPFWSLSLWPRGDEWDAPDTGRRDLTLLGSAVAPNGYYARFEEGPTLNRTLIVRRMSCGDGMSDRQFGWQASVFVEAPDGNESLGGCCTLDER